MNRDLLLRIGIKDMVFSGTGTLTDTHNTIKLPISWVSEMTRIEHIAMIAHDMGLIFEFLGVASLLPFLVLVVFREWDLVLPMATAPATFLLLG
jgi:hypothetical protein